jgi:hypothetical protein
MPDDHIPPKDDLEKAVREALETRGKDAKDGERAALVRLVLGLLRLMVDPTGGLPATLASTLFGLAPVPVQTAQKIVDYWIEGIKDVPPFPWRPQMWPIVASAFQTVLEPIPDATTMGVLVNVCIGIIQDRYPNGPHAAKQGVAQALVQAYNVGG